MRPPHRILNRNQVLRLAAEHLQTHLQFQDDKRKTSAQVLWSLLLATAARITSLSDALQRRRDAPSDETARKALLATLPDDARLQQRPNAALAGLLPMPLRTRLQRLAVDLRLLAVGIALVLRNRWVWRHDTILSMPRRGGRMIQLERLRWETLLLWFLHVVEETFGVADATDTERDVPL